MCGTGPILLGLGSPPFLGERGRLWSQEAFQQRFFLLMQKWLKQHALFLQASSSQAVLENLGGFHINRVMIHVDCDQGACVAHALTQSQRGRVQLREVGKKRDALY